ncbi:40S ribosomal protein S15a-1-like protein [Tanacetum coccineum]
MLLIECGHGKDKDDSMRLTDDGRWNVKKWERCGINVSVLVRTSKETVNASIDKSVEVAVQSGSRALASNQRESGKGKGIKLEGETMETTKGTLSNHFKVKRIDRIGLCMLTDHLGIVDHEEARRKNVGDKVLGFFHWVVEVLEIFLEMLYKTIEGKKVCLC